MRDVQVDERVNVEGLQVAAQGGAVGDGDRASARQPGVVDGHRKTAQAEHALMARLVTFADVPNLSEQVATVRVVSTCDCGCASVGLSTEGPQVPATAVARLSDTGRDDYFAVSASDGGDVSVVLHVTGGSSESWRSSRARAYRLSRRTPTV